MLDMTLTTARNLRMALLGNAVFSTLSGAILLLADPLIPVWLGIPDTNLQWLGGGLLAFAAYLLFLFKAKKLPRDLVTGVIGGDWFWVAASLALIGLKPQWFSSLGIALILGVAAIVMAFALLQGRGLRKMNAAAA